MFGTETSGRIYVTRSWKVKTLVLVVQLCPDRSQASSALEPRPRIAEDSELKTVDLTAAGSGAFGATREVMVTPLDWAIVHRDRSSDICSSDRKHARCKFACQLEDLELKHRRSERLGVVPKRVSGCEE